MAFYVSLPPPSFLSALPRTLTATYCNTFCFRKTTANCRALLRKMTNKSKAFHESLPAPSFQPSHAHLLQHAATHSLSHYNVLEHILQHILALTTTHCNTHLPFHIHTHARTHTHTHLITHTLSLSHTHTLSLSLYIYT